MKLNFKKGAIGISIVAAILLTAKSYIGQEETPGNSGFKDKVVQSAFEHAGWRKGASWCVFFCKVVYDQALIDLAHASGYAREREELTKIHDRAMKLIVGNSQTTLANFEKYVSTTLDKPPMFVVSDSAVPGGIVIWQSYKNGVPQWSGHAGICIGTHFDTVGYDRLSVTTPLQFDFTTIEGNTNDNGSANGYKVAVKHRRYNTDCKNGLRYRKCISIRYQVSSIKYQVSGIKYQEWGEAA